MAIVLAIFFYIAKNRRISFFLALTGILLVLCRYLTTLIESPIDFAFYVVFPLFITAIALRIHYKLRKSDSSNEEQKERVIERRPRVLKVRGVVSEDGNEVDNAPPVQVKLNRPFGS